MLREDGGEVFSSVWQVNSIDRIDRIDRGKPSIIVIFHPCDRLRSIFFQSSTAIQPCKVTVCSNSDDSSPFMPFHRKFNFNTEFSQNWSDAPRCPDKVCGLLE